MANEELDDPVEHEYPLRPLRMSYENTEHFKARVKPGQKRIELEISLNTKSLNYSKSKGEQIAVNVDGCSELIKEDPSFASGMMDKQILRSVPCSVDSRRYAVGVLKNDELHLTPVHAVVQMRPTFDYLDRADNKQKETTSADAADSSQDELEEEAKPVTVKFARPESEEAKARRIASFEYIQQQLEDEPWCPLTFHNLHDDEVEPEFQLLFASHGGEKVQQFQSSMTDYLKNLVPVSANDNVEKPALPDSVLSLTHLRTLPLADQVRALLISVKVMRFSQLMELLPKGTDPQAALRLLQQVAVMVQGCWVVKSEILYPKDATSPHSGISAEHLCRGRDFIMWKFTHCKYVVRKEISSGLPSEDVKDMLEQMSRLRTSKGWEFVFDYDRDFVERHTDVVQRQRLLWDAKFQQLAKHFKMPKDADKKAKEAELGLMNLNFDRPRRRRASSRSSPRKRTLSGRSMSDMSDMETDGTPTSSDRKDNIDFLKIEPMEICSDSPSDLHLPNGQFSSNLPSLLDSCDKNDCRELENELLLKRELQAFARDILTQRHVVTLGEVKRLFYLKLSTCPPGHVLSSGVSDKMLEEGFLSAGGIRLNNQWPPNTKSEAIYAMVNNGDKTDKVRQVFFNMFQSAFRFKTNIFISRIKETFGDEFSETDCKKIIREICESYKSTWYLKGTSPSHS